MRDYLVFRLYGPLVSWGDIAVGEYRPSFVHPSKSAIIGLCAAALGIRRDEEERQQRLAESCSFAVRVDSMGILLRDYHTSEVPRGDGFATRRREIHAVLDQKRSGTQFKGTILSSRDYRCDAVYTVAISVSDGAPLSVQELATALKKPVFTLYLGRKSCPLSLPLQPQIINKATLREAFESASFGEDLASIITSGVALIYWEDNSESGLERQQVITRRDAPRSRKRWQFVERRENYGTMKMEETPCTSA